MKKVNIISINPITDIPSLRYVIECLTDQLRYDVEITACFVDNTNNYYENLENVTLNKAYKFRDYIKFQGQNNLVKLIKYFRIFLKCITLLYKNKNVNLYVTEYQILAIVIFIKRTFKFHTLSIVYHQYELVDIDFLSKIGIHIYKYVSNRSDSICLAIFPEHNRCKHFCFETNMLPGNTYVFPNTCRVTKIEGTEDVLYINIPKDMTVIGHIGSISEKYFYFDEFFDLIKRFEKENICFLFVGRQIKRFKSRVNQLGIKNILLFDEVPHQHLQYIYSRMNIGLILYKGVILNHEYCAPNKLYEYWSFGVPVIAHRLTALNDIFISKCQGELVDMHNISQVERAIRKRIKNNLGGECLIKYFESNLSIDNYLPRLTSRLNECLLK